MAGTSNGPNEHYNIARGTTLLASHQAVVTITEMTFYILLLRMFTLQDIGRVSLLAALLGIFTTITQLALPTAATRFISKSLGHNDQATALGVTRTSLRLLMTIALPVLVLGIIFSPNLATGIFHNPDTSLLVVGTFLTGFLLDLTNLIGSYFLGTGHYNRIVYQNILYTPLSRGLGLVLATTSLRLEGIILGWIIGALATLFLSLHLWNGKLTSGENNHTSSFPTRPLLAFSLPIYAYALINLGQGYGDLAILQAQLGSLSTTGTYFLLLTTSGWLQILWVPLATTIAPALSLTYAKNGAKAVELKLNTILRLVNLTVIPACTALVAVAPTILSTIYSQALASETLPATIMLITTIFTAQGLILITGLHAVGNTRPLVPIAIITTMIELGFVAMTARYLGTTAGALGRSILAATTLLLAYRAMRKSITLNIGNSLFQSLLLSIVACIPLLLVDQALTHMQIQAMSRIPILLLVLALSFPAASRRLSIFTTEDLGRLEDILPSRLQFLAKSAQRVLIVQVTSPSAVLRGIEDSTVP